ncbi:MULTISPECIES: hypothetical protein [Sinorhizobium]|uniref:hypothetical protein n=1 Tax=Sinorhizobium TaxID=28105 RepID=UPI001304DAEF|nr:MULTISPECIES: hypothetical protein [Sinorhizobium]MBO1962346.1 hypothetical protein [Sinorhizobium medicae]WQO47082.1 hypothetical protein U8C42_09255 [Sinorhizobium medicae]WQO63744.1 hypothetical protein U8C40_11045 [Sinorhizobium medicae]WQO74445.1 hypothetical protein U8C31_09390 [Sinorhizobium medicae]WQO93752.1 hypothetical protein U8C32_09400 [Sinorhizobium medicae]
MPLTDEKIRCNPALDGFAAVFGLNITILHHADALSRAARWEASHSKVTPLIFRLWLADTTLIQCFGLMLSRRRI